MFRSSTIPISRELIERLGYFYKYEAALPREVYQFIVLTPPNAPAWLSYGRIMSPRRGRAGLDESVDPFDRRGSEELSCAVRVVAERRMPRSPIARFPRRSRRASSESFGVQGLIEIVTLCGFYTLTAMVNVCFDVPLPHRAQF